MQTERKMPNLNLRPQNAALNFNGENVVFGKKIKEELERDKEIKLHSSAGPNVFY